MKNITPPSTFETALLGIFMWAEKNSLEDQEHLQVLRDNHDEWQEKALDVIRSDQDSMGIWKQFVRELAALAPADQEDTSTWLLSVIADHE